LGLRPRPGSFGHTPNRGQTSYRGTTAIINPLPIIPLSGSYIGEHPRRPSLVTVNRIPVFHSPLGFIIGRIILVHIAPLHTFPSPNPSDPIRPFMLSTLLILPL
jgi:quinol-cytochrome oxidoreductase complex cytochrome b subunit